MQIKALWTNLPFPTSPAIRARPSLPAASWYSNCQLVSLSWTLLCVHVRSILSDINACARTRQRTRTRTLQYAYHIIWVRYVPERALKKRTADLSVIMNIDSCHNSPQKPCPSLAQARDAIVGGLRGVILQKQSFETARNITRPPSCGS